MHARYLVVGLLVVSSTVGCRSLLSKRPPAAPPGAPGAPAASVTPAPVTPPPVAEPPLKKQLGHLEDALSDAHRNQERISRDLQDLRKDMFESAKGLRDLKDRADLVIGALETNRATVASLEENLRQVRARVENSAKGGAPEAEALRAALEKSQQQQARDAVIAQEREKEMKDLRAAIDARDALLRKSPAPAAAAAAAPAVPAAPAIAAATTPAAKPAAAPAPAPASSDVATGSVYKLIADGNIALKDSDLGRAHDLFASALRQDPTLLGARLGLAACAYQTDDLKEARRLVDSVLLDDKENAQALGLRGILQWKEGYVAEAVSDCGRAVQRAPDDAMLHKFYGIVLHARNRPADAINEMRRAIDLDPNDAEAKLNLAILLATDRRPSMDEARVLYEQALAAGVARDAALDQLLYPKPQ